MVMSWTCKTVWLWSWPVIWKTLGYETFSGASFGSQWCRKTTFENIPGSPFWDPGPSDPREVPRDQNFWVKIFLISTSNDLILWVFWITYAKNGHVWKNTLILPILLLLYKSIEKDPSFPFLAIFCISNTQNS